MKNDGSSRVKAALQAISHTLPDQAPLQNFVHHNTLHAFQHMPFHEALQMATENFGYTVYWSLEEYRKRYHQQKINHDIVDRVIAEHKNPEERAYWKDLMLNYSATKCPEPKIGRIRKLWKTAFHINLDKEVHQLLFKIVSAYLDQGIAIWKFPIENSGLLTAVRALEENSHTNFVSSVRARNLLLSPTTRLEDLLELLVGHEAWYSHYLFDQQFAHPGWSGMVSVLEKKADHLLDKRKVSLHDLVFLECILEIDALDRRRKNWSSLARHIPEDLSPLFEKPEYSEWCELHKLWQEALEWSYYDQVIRGLQLTDEKNEPSIPSLQALFCIDDRSCSIRRYVERFDPKARTFGTAGFFNLPFYFQPEHGKFFTKVCPPSLDPSHIIKETESKIRHEKDAQYSKHSKGIFGGWAFSQTLGFWYALKLAKNIFFPSPSPAMVSSFRHMDPQGKLSITCKNPAHRYHGLQVGFTTAEMAEALEGLLHSIGLVKDFAPLVYVLGHGASSVNNTHYAGYDCGACSGRAGSVNARVAAAIGNHPEVRALLEKKGISIPKETQFIGGLHDTTRDEMEFYDVDVLTDANKALHNSNVKTFDNALHYNAKERSRRFDTIDSKQNAEKVHEEVKKRSLSLFVTRPEWNHATNAICIVGKRANNKHLFLDKRAFLNSYDHSIDPSGHYLQSIMNAVASVCGGINLEYYFSKVDTARLGAGSKLSHNVMGLIGVANGMDGDLRTGLPEQMVNIHDPLRILVTVEHYPDILLNAIRSNPNTYEWFANDWVKLVCINPENKSALVFKNGGFVAYTPTHTDIPKVENLDELIESTDANLPVYLLS